MADALPSPSHPVPTSPIRPPPDARIELPENAAGGLGRDCRTTGWGRDPRQESWDTLWGHNVVKPSGETETPRQPTLRKALR
jgi:hypothetical protein